MTNLRLTNYPEALRDGNFVAVCSHLKDNWAACWGDGGVAKNASDEALAPAGVHVPQTAFFHFSAMCGACASKVDRSEIEFRRVKFYNGALNFGWWEFQPTRNLGRPKKA